MTLTYNEVGIEVEGLFLPTESISFSSKSSLAPFRTVAPSMPVRWGISSAREDKISLQGYMLPESAVIFGNTGQISGMTLNFAGMTCSGVQIDRLNYSITPFAPIRLDVEMSIHGGISGAVDGTLLDTRSGILPYRYETPADLMHGLFTDFRGFDEDENVTNPFTVKVSYEFVREPRFLAGDTYPDRVSLLRAEKTVTIEGDGWDKIISIAGNDITGSITLSSSADAWGLGYSASGAVSGHAFLNQIIPLFQEIVTSGRIVEQTLETEEILAGSITIKEVLL